MCRKLQRTDEVDIEDGCSIFHENGHFAGKTERIEFNNV